jgi:UDP-3-O-[3-hydroxymyristoyl] glucosamine N-acyltransferase
VCVGSAVYVGGGVGVGPEVYVGRGVGVGPEVYVGSEVGIGPEVYVGSAVYVGSEVYVGNEVLVAVSSGAWVSSTSTIVDVGRRKTKVGVSEGVIDGGWLGKYVMEGIGVGETSMAV